MRCRMLSDELTERFGTKVYRLSLSSGCTCPNRDGTIGTGGCTFCPDTGSGEFAASFLSLDEQIRLARQKVDAKFPKDIAPGDRRYIAYFQSYTNTYGDPARLRELYLSAVRRPEIAALSVATRPDCLPDDILDMLGEVSRIKPVWVELGLQTVHERTAEEFRRGYTLPVFEKAFRELKERGIEVIVHVIFGLPGETEEDMLDTVRYLAALAPLPDGVKFHQLQILKGTEMAKRYEREHFPVMTLDEYGSLLKKALEILPDPVVIHRLTGDGPKPLLIEPKWSADKKRVLNTLRSILQ